MRARGGRRHVMNADEIAAYYTKREGIRAALATYKANGKTQVAAQMALAIHKATKISK